jgi:hypothetical protein
VKDPIENENFIELIKQQNNNLEPGPSDFVGSTEVDSSGKKEDDGQATLGTSQESIELKPYQEEVRDRMHETLDGQEVDISDREPSYYEMLGVVPLGNEPEDIDINGTVFDANHAVWNTQETQDWVQDADDAFNAVDEALSELNKKGVFTMTPIEKEKGQPSKVRVDVKSESEL